MKRREIPEPEYDNPKELYALFGLAFYDAQVLEQGFVNLAVALNAKGMGNITVKDILELYKHFDEKTFGKVLRTTRQLTTFPPSLEADLKTALYYRNYLAHSFFVDHSEDAITQEGRHAMIDELRLIIEFLIRVDSEFDPIWMAAWHKLGITQEWFDRKFRDIEQALADERIGQQPASNGADKPGRSD